MPRRTNANQHSAAALKRKRLLRIQEVIYLIGLSRSSLYQRMASREFPKPVKLGKRAVAWRARDIDRSISTRERKP